MLFETEKKADTFIKFNAEEIEEETGYKPERSYFCVYCNGWHVTSKKEFFNVESKTERVLDEYEKYKSFTNRPKKSTTITPLIVKEKSKKEIKEMLRSIRVKIDILEKNKDSKELVDYDAILENACDEFKVVKESGKGKLKKKNRVEELLYNIKNGIDVTENPFTEKEVQNKSKAKNTKKQIIQKGIRNKKEQITDYFQTLELNIRLLEIIKNNKNKNECIDVINDSLTIMAKLNRILSSLELTFKKMYTESETSSKLALRKKRKVNIEKKLYELKNEIEDAIELQKNE